MRLAASAGTHLDSPKCDSPVSYFRTLHTPSYCCPNRSSPCFSASARRRSALRVVGGLRGHRPPHLIRSTIMAFGYQYLEEKAKPAPPMLPSRPHQMGIVRYLLARARLGQIGPVALACITSAARLNAHHNQMISVSSIGLEPTHFTFSM